MTFKPEDDDERSPCSFFCLWTHLHGWRHFALAKNKGYWVIWIVIFLILIILCLLTLAGKTAFFMSGLSDFYGKWDTIEESDGRFPALTICKETPGFSDAKSDMCEELGVSLMWRNAEVKMDSIKFNTTATDHGMCCNVYVKYDADNKETWPKVGMMNGMKVVAYPGSNEGGVFVALHQNKDVPLMNIQGKTKVSPVYSFLYT